MHNLLSTNDLSITWDVIVINHRSAAP